MLQVKNSEGNYVDVEDIKAENVFEGTSPVTFKGTGENLINYRIYGSTVDEESVGDLVTEGEHAGEYLVPVTVAGKNLFDISTVTANAFINVNTGVVTPSSTANSNVSDFIPVLANANYIFSFDVNLQAGYTFVIAYYGEDKTYLQIKSNYNSSSNVYHYQLAFTPTNNGFIRIKYSSNSINMQVEKGSSSTPYEPYQPPVTTNLYLPEQIKMVGDEAEYVDYKEQKQYFADGTSTAVTLPALPTLSGTNTLSVGTTVQPSKIWGKIEETKDIEYIKDNLGNTLYKKYKEIETEIVPMSFISKRNELKNYRIYGNTINNESVGDKTPNLWDEKIIQGGTNNSGIIVDGNSKRLRSDYIPVESGETYTFTSNLKLRLIYSYNDNNEKVSLILDTGPGVTSYTFTIPDGASKIIITVMKREGNTEYDITPDDFKWGQLEKSSVATLYEPYGYRLPIVVENPLADNLFNVSEFLNRTTRIVEGTIEKLFDSFIINSTGNDCYTVSYESTDSNSYKVNVQPNTTYTLSWKSNDTNSRLRILIFLNGQVTSGSVFEVDRTKNTFTFTTNSDTSYVTFRFGIGPASQALSILFYDIFFVEGEQAGNLVSSTNIYLPEPLRKVGNETDYIDYKEQKQYRVRKNLLKKIAVSQQISGVTFTVNDDGSITCNGTAMNVAFFTIFNKFYFSETIILTGCPEGGSNNNYCIKVQKPNGEVITNDFGKGVTISNFNNISSAVIRIASGYNCDNLVFYPMIRKANIKDDTYEPYIEDNELDVELPSISLIEGTNNLSIDTTVQPTKIYLKGKIENL